MIKHILRYFMFAGSLFAAAAPLIAGGGSDGGAASAPSSTPAGGTPAPSSPAAPPAAAQPGQGDQNIRQLRENYDTLKSKYEPWEKLQFKPEQVTQFHGIYEKVSGEVTAIGRELGYSDAEIAEAMAEDPIRTLDYLRNETLQRGNGQQPRGEGQDLQDLVAQHVEQAIGPIQQRENQRMTSEANSVFERTVHRLAVDSFKAEGVDVANIPQDELDFLATATSEMMKYDANALKELKFQGKTASIQKYFNEARTALDKYYLARSGRERAKAAHPARPGAPAAAAGDGKRPTLDEMIANPGVINQKYA